MWKNNDYYTFRKCLFTALLIQHTTWMRRNVISFLIGTTQFVSHFLTNCTIFDKMLRKVRYVLLFPLQSLSETFAILRSTERNVIKDEYWSSCKVPIILVRLKWILNSLDRVCKINLILNFMKILPAEAQLIHADRPTVGRTHWWTDGQYWQKKILAFRKFGKRLHLHSVFRNINYISEDQALSHSIR